MDKNNLEKIASDFNYTLDYLTSGSPIFQIKNLYTFTSDSIHLAHAVKEDYIETLIDLCAGSGVVGLEVVGNKQVKNLILVELQKELAECATNSAKVNLSKTNITVLNKNVTELSSVLQEGGADVVVCNPPYFKKGSGDVPSNLSRAMARHELTLTLKDLTKEVSRLLKAGGKFYLIHLYSRQKEIEKELLGAGFNIISRTELSGKLKRIIVESQKI